MKMSRQPLQPIHTNNLSDVTKNLEESNNHHDEIKQEREKREQKENNLVNIHNENHGSNETMYNDQSTAHGSTQEIQKLTASLRKQKRSKGFTITNQNPKRRRSIFQNRRNTSIGFDRHNNDAETETRDDSIKPIRVPLHEQKKYEDESLFFGLEREDTLELKFQEEQMQLQIQQEQKKLEEQQQLRQQQQQSFSKDENISDDLVLKIHNSKGEEEDDTINLIHLNDKTRPIPGVKHHVHQISKQSKLSKLNNNNSSASSNYEILDENVEKNSSLVSAGGSSIDSLFKGLLDPNDDTDDSKLTTTSSKLHQGEPSPTKKNNSDIQKVQKQRSNIEEIYPLQTKYQDGIQTDIDKSTSISTKSDSDTITSTLNATGNSIDSLFKGLMGPVDQHKSYSSKTETSSSSRNNQTSSAEKIGTSGTIGSNIEPTLQGLPVDTKMKTNEINFDKKLVQDESSPNTKNGNVLSSQEYIKNSSKRSQSLTSSDINAHEKLIDTTEQSIESLFDGLIGSENHDTSYLMQSKNNSVSPSTENNKFHSNSQKSKKESKTRSISYVDSPARSTRSNMKKMKMEAKNSSTPKEDDNIDPIGSNLSFLSMQSSDFSSLLTNNPSPEREGGQLSSPPVLHHADSPANNTRSRSRRKSSPLVKGHRLSPPKMLHFADSPAKNTRSHSRLKSGTNMSSPLLPLFKNAIKKDDESKNNVSLDNCVKDTQNSSHKEKLQEKNEIADTQILDGLVQSIAAYDDLCKENLGKVENGAKNAKDSDNTPQKAIQLHGAATNKQLNPLESPENNLKEGKVVDTIEKKAKGKTVDTIEKKAKNKPHVSKASEENNETLNTTRSIQSESSTYDMSIDFESDIGTNMGEISESESTKEFKELESLVESEFESNILDDISLSSESDKVLKFDGKLLNNAQASPSLNSSLPKIKFNDKYKSPSTERHYKSNITNSNSSTDGADNYTKSTVDDENTEILKESVKATNENVYFRSQNSVSKQPISILNSSKKKNNKNEVIIGELKQKNECSAVKRKTVAFGSPEAAEYNLGSPSVSMTPMHPNAVKAMFMMPNENINSDNCTDKNVGNNWSKAHKKEELSLVDIEEETGTALLEENINDFLQNNKAGIEIDENQKDLNLQSNALDTVQLEHNVFELLDKTNVKSQFNDESNHLSSNETTINSSISDPTMKLEHDMTSFLRNTAIESAPLDNKYNDEYQMSNPNEISSPNEINQENSILIADASNFAELMSNSMAGHSVSQNSIFAPPKDSGDKQEELDGPIRGQKLNFERKDDCNTKEQHYDEDTISHSSPENSKTYELEENIGEFLSSLQMKSVGNKKIETEKVKHNFFSSPSNDVNKVTKEAESRYDEDTKTMQLEKNIEALISTVLGENPSQQKSKIDSEYQSGASKNVKKRRGQSQQSSRRISLATPAKRRFSFDETDFYENNSVTSASLAINTPSSFNSTRDIEVEKQESQLGFSKEQASELFDLTFHEVIEASELWSQKSNHTSSDSFLIHSCNEFNTNRCAAIVSSVNTFLHAVCEEVECKAESCGGDKSTVFSFSSDVNLDVMMQLQKTVRNDKNVDHTKLKEQLKTLAKVVCEYVVFGWVVWETKVSEALQGNFTALTKNVDNERAAIDHNISLINNSHEVVSAASDVVVKKARRKSMSRRQTAVYAIEEKIKSVAAEIEQLESFIKSKKLEVGEISSLIRIANSIETSKDEISKFTNIAEDRRIEVISTEGLYSWSPSILNENLVKLVFPTSFYATHVQLLFSLTRVPIQCTLFVDESKRHLKGSLSKDGVEKFISERLKEICNTSTCCIQTTNQISKVSQHVSWKLRRLDLIGKELMQLISRYDSILKHEYNEGYAYPFSSMEVSMEVVKGEVDIDELSRQLLNTVRPGYGYLSRACNIFSTFMK